MKMAEGILSSSNLTGEIINSPSGVFCMTSVHTGEVQTISILNNFTVAEIKYFSAGTDMPLEFSRNTEIDLYTGFYGISVPLSIQLFGSMSNISVQQATQALVPKILTFNQLFSETIVLQNTETAYATHIYKFQYTISYEMTNIGTHINIKLNSGIYSHTVGGGPLGVTLSLSITSK